MDYQSKLLEAQDVVCAHLNTPEMTDSQRQACWDRVCAKLGELVDDFTRVKCKANTEDIAYMKRLCARGSIAKAIVAIGEIAAYDTGRNAVTWDQFLLVAEDLILEIAEG